MTAYFESIGRMGVGGGVIMIARTLFNDQPSYDMGSPDKVTEEESMNTIE